MLNKLAIITSHPIQYYAPWFRYLAHQPDLSIRVFYLWNFGITQQKDPQFQQTIQWDIPLLSGYEHEFVENSSTQPGTHHFWGLQNPSLVKQVETYAPNAVLLMNYNYASLYRFLWQWHQSPILFRGDSHQLQPPLGLKNALRRFWISRIYQRCAACLYVGQANYDYFRYHGVKAEQLFFSPHAVDNERFITQSSAATYQAKSWQKELGIPEDHGIILFAGKFIEKKRPLDLLQAFIQANLRHVSLLFVGSGPLENQLKLSAANHPHIYFGPFQNQSEMPKTLAIADLIVLPSFGSGETWGLVINEAMCLAKAVVVSSHVGCAKDLIQSGHNGLIFPAGDIPALANCLRIAFSDRNKLKSWGKLSRDIIQNYSYLKSTDGLKSALKFCQHNP